MAENKIYFYARPWELSSSDKYPCFLLTTGDQWNDFGYRTLFRLYYYRNKEDYLMIGEVKILQLGQESTNLPSEFESLDENYCSLGQSVEYYENLREFGNEINIKLLLQNLNDAAYFPSIKAKYENEAAFTTSLLRFSETEKALQEGKRIIDGVEIENVFNFTFSCQLRNAAKEHVINFNYNKDISDLNRIIALVGKNGTGKTQVLAKFANSLSGNQKEGEFSYRPPFSKVIAVSYSLFDKFDIPESTDTFSYVYCGIRNQVGLLNDSQLLEKLKNAVDEIGNKGRQNKYYETLKNIIDEDVIDNLLDDKGNFQNGFINNVIDNKIALSSGQSIYIYILSEIFANIQNESLLLFDEPETHLHPNAIAKIINSLYNILSSFNSYAVIATHSPIIIQQIPSRYVQVFERVGNVPIVRNLYIESFGENLSNITNDIFETVNVEENYKIKLVQLAATYSYESILEMFENNLSFNAKTYLRNLYKK